MAVVGESRFPGGVVDRVAGHDTVDREPDLAPENISIKRYSGVLFEQSAQAAFGKVYLGGEGVDAEVAGMGGVDGCSYSQDAWIGFEPAGTREGIQDAA